MKVEELVVGLHSKLRRNILELLCKQDRTAVEIYKELKGNAPKFRQSVNRALDVLVQCGFLKKYYDDKKKALCYQIMKSEFHIDLKDMSVK